MSLIAMLTMTAIASGVVTIDGRAWAQSVAQPSFDIPAGPLNRALTAFGRQAGLQVTYLASTAAGKTSPGLSGPTTREQAIARILHGTGLSYRFTNATTVAISAPATTSSTAASDGAMLLDTIDVQGSTETAWGPVAGVVAHRSATGTKTDTPLLETPQSISVVTADQVSQQATQTIGETVRYTPGTRGDIFGISTARDYIRVRGFSPNYYQDGLILPYGLTAQGGQSEPYGMERTEVLRGPSSVLYGQNPPGGIINMVSKRPLKEARNEVFVQGGSFGRIQAGFDFTGPVNGDERLLYRVVGMGRKSGTQVDYADDDRYYLAPSLTWKPVETTSLTVLGQLQRDNAGIIDQYFPSLGTLYPNPNGRIRRSTNIGEPGVDAQKRAMYSIGYELSHKLDNGITLRQNARYMDIDVYNASTFTGSLLPDNRTISRSFSVINRRLKYFTLDNQALADVTTGPLTHKLIVGLDYRHSTEAALNGSAAAPDLDLYNPVYGRTFGAFSYDQRYRESASQLGLYAQDQIRLGQWLLTLGGRYDWADTGYDNHVSGVNTKTFDRAFTGRAGLTYLFENGIAPYVSYSTSFQPVLGVTSAARGSETFKPTKGRQLEAGIKYQPTSFDGLFTAAVFDLTQTNVSAVDPDDVRYEIQTGEVRSRGFEFEARANLTSKISLIGAYSFVDTKVTKTNDPNQFGRQLPSIPRQQASLWVNYGLEGALNGVTLGAGVRHVGSSYGDTANQWKTRGYTLIDASLRLDLGKLWPEAKGTTFQINATNLFDKETVNVCFGADYCMLGQGRTILATLKHQW